MPEPTTEESQDFCPPPDLRDDPDVIRDKIVMVRLTADEETAWKAAAEADQRKLADWIRVVVNAQLPSIPRTSKSTAAKPRPRKKGGR